MSLRKRSNLSLLISLTTKQKRTFFTIQNVILNYIHNLIIRSILKKSLAIVFSIVKECILFL